jgi:hypothetical protein
MHAPFNAADLLLFDSQPYLATSLTHAAHFPNFSLSLSRRALQESRAIGSGSSVESGEQLRSGLRCRWWRLPGGRASPLSELAATPSLSLADGGGDG